jgi:hypothetical protein
MTGYLLAPASRKMQILTEESDKSTSPDQQTVSDRRASEPDSAEKWPGF